MITTTKAKIEERRTREKGYGVREWRSRVLTARGLALQMDSTVVRSPFLAAAWRSEDSLPPFGNRFFLLDAAPGSPISAGCAVVELQATKAAVVHT